MIKNKEGVSIKTIALITHSIKTSVSYSERIQFLFDGTIQIEAYTLNQLLPEQIVADIALVSTYAVYALIESRLQGCNHVIIADITLSKEALNKLRRLPAGTQAMLVNTTMEMAADTISLIRNTGIRHIELVPVYSGISHLPDLTMAITPGEIELVPPQATQVLDLGDRVLSARTITNLAVELELTKLLQSDRIKQYFNSLSGNDQGVEQMLTQMQEQKQKLQLLMEVFDGGILALTGTGIISFLNSAAETILGKDAFSVLGQPIDDILPELKQFHITTMVNPLRDHVVNLHGQTMDLSIYPLSKISTDQEYILMFRTLEDVEQNQYQIRRQLMSKGHTAKHTFSDIITQHPKMVQLKNAAERMAKSSSSIVIYGPSGTGKELFAQSIHNASLRKNYPFIAINCASIPETLLESELFGYSEGAFTGAKKGGKRGFFELAHQGTLFLDEIGEMDLALQARILRVLQEREVTRVGGDSVISVDVRIISASNQRLLELVGQKKFREDLYYRLNVLSIEIPSLRERQDDIPLLIEALSHRVGCDFSLSADALSFVKNYPWNGNVRELGNFVERLQYLDHMVISLDDVKSQLDDHASSSLIGQKNLFFTFFLSLSSEKKFQYAAILSLLQERLQQRLHTGRRELSRCLAARGIFLSEQQVRSILHTLQHYHLVQIYVGRGGTELTAEGCSLVSKVVDQVVD